MDKLIKKIGLVLFLIVSVFFFGACNLNINESCWVDEGEMSHGSMNTINGKINIGKNADVKGECRSVNGSIHVGSNSKVRDLLSVNGNVRIERDALVKGDIQLVNGNVYCEPGVKVRGCIQTINGKTRLERTSVEEDLTTYNGSILLNDNTKIEGDIIIKEKHGFSSDFHDLEIEIDDSHVEGNIINEDHDTDVTVYLINRGNVSGKIINAKVIEK